MAGRENSVATDEFPGECVVAARSQRAIKSGTCGERAEGKRDRGGAPSVGRARRVSRRAEPTRSVRRTKIDRLGGACSPPPRSSYHRSARRGIPDTRCRPGPGREPTPPGQYGPRTQSGRRRASSPHTNTGRQAMARPSHRWPDSGNRRTGYRRSGTGTSQAGRAASVQRRWPGSYAKDQWPPKGWGCPIPIHHTDIHDPPSTQPDEWPRYGLSENPNGMSGRSLVARIVFVSW